MILFFIVFELSLAPMFLLVCNDGSRSRKLRAGYYLAIYTLISGITLTLGIISFFVETGFFNINYITFLGTSLQGKQDTI